MIHAYAISGAMSKKSSQRAYEAFSLSAQKLIEKKTTSYITNLWIGPAESRVRLMLEEIESKDSRVAINGALDKFYAQFANKEFNFMVKHHNILGGFENVVAKLKMIELIDITTLKFEPKTKLTLELTVPQKGGGDAIDEIQMHGYFYLSGEIKAETHAGKQYSDIKKTFKDVQVTEVDSVDFTSLNFYYERTQKSQELLTVVPF